jgi:ion channel
MLARVTATAAGDRRVVQHRYGLLLITLFLLLIVQGIGPNSAVQELIVTALAGAAAAFAVRAAGFPTRIVRLAAVLALLVLLLSAVRAIFGGIGEGAALVMNAALVSIGPPAVVLGIVRDLRATGQVRLTAVMGVLSLYLLLGMVFAFTYAAIDEIAPPFFASGVNASTSDCLYFSFTTLTTVGYGDFVARTNLGHTLAVVEALIGQIYLVTVVSLIVSNLGRPARTRA